MNFSKLNFHPVIHMPKDCPILDFTENSAQNSLDCEWSFGRYNEERIGLYTQPLFEDKRNIHMGIDLGAPAGTEVFSFYQGILLFFQDNDQPGDYGPTLVVEYDLCGTKMYALYGHLSRMSLRDKFVGKKIAQGEILGWTGERNENGGWPPHLHFQLSLQKPTCADMPGVVTQTYLETALKIYPDPRIVLGDLAG